MNVENREKPDSSLRLAVVSTAIILVFFAIAIAAYFLYRHRGELLKPGKKEGDFLETFDDDNIDPGIVILTNGGTKYGVEKGKLFFDQGSSTSDAHMWYHSTPLDLTRPFVIKVRAKTDNYIRSAIQGCCVMMLWSCEKDFPVLYPGGRLAHSNEMFQVVLLGASGGFHSGIHRTLSLVHGNPSHQWNFKKKKWVTENTDPLEMCYPYPGATFITAELHSTPESFFVRWRDNGGRLLYETSPKKWNSVPRMKKGGKIYLAGGEQLTSWWSNDMWVDYIRIEYE
ncbi:MAG: hypothetical protein ACYS8W_06965 [Planctomycetota bacterium]|jgi:hypothetical protein